MERPRLCIVVGQLARGGLEKQAYLIATGLSRRGFEVTVVSLSAGGVWADALTAAGVPLVQLKRRRHFDLGRLVDLVAVFREVRPDLVYAFNHPTTVYARLAGLAASVPLLITGERGIYMNRVQGFLERILARVTECVICNADAIRRDLVERIGIQSRKVITVRNGIEPRPEGGVEARLSARMLLGIPEGSFVVGTVGHFEDEKNLPMLVDVARLARDSGLDVRFCIIGDGSRKHAIASMIHDLALDDLFVLAGERPNAADFLPAFDVFVLTSGYEGLPNAVMEAMAAALPCVCTDAGGCRELVEEGVTGFLVPPGDAAAMANILKQLAGEQRLRATLGASGRARIVNEFSLERLLSQTEAIFQNLLAARDRSPRGGRLHARAAALAE